MLIYNDVRHDVKRDVRRDVMDSLYSQRKPRRDESVKYYGLLHYLSIVRYANGFLYLYMMLLAFCKIHVLSENYTMISNPEAKLVDMLLANSNPNSKPWMGNTEVRILFQLGRIASLVNLYQYIYQFPTHKTTKLQQRQDSE